MTRWRALAWIAGLTLFAAALYLAIRLTRDLTDFEVYRTAGTRLLARASLYRPEDGHFVFKYLPAFAFVAAPFALLSAEVAKAAWFALTFACLALFVYWSVRALPNRRRALAPLFALTLLITARFAIRELSLGQNNALLGVLLISVLPAVTGGARRFAGGLVGGAVFVKPYAALLVPWLALEAGSAAVAICVAVMAIGLLLPATIYGWSGNLSLLGAWFRTVTETTAPNLLLPENISFVSAWAKWLGPGQLATALASASAMGVLGLVIWVVRKRALVNLPGYLEVALLLVLIPVLTPQGWDYMLLLGTPAIVCLVDRWSDLGTAWRLGVIAAFAVIGWPVREVFGLAAARAVMHTGVVTAAAVVLAAALVHLRLVRAA